MIASVTVFYDNVIDEIDKWAIFYSEYSKLIAKHIIVDNNSHPDYAARMRERFPNSLIVTRPTNGGTTGGFNTGIVYALNDRDVDAILLISADMRLASDALAQLYELLFSASDIGVVGGVILAAGNSNQVESYGGSLRKETFALTYNYGRCSLSDQLPPVLEVDFICGGINLARREVYECVGLQDEDLFMYADEIDWDYRVQLAGYRLLVTKSAQIWHEHNMRPQTNDQNRRLARFYDSRNHVYLIRKYHGRKRALAYFLKSLLPYPRRIGGAILHDPSALESFIWPQLIGGIYGVLGLMGKRKLYSI